MHALALMKLMGRACVRWGFLTRQIHVVQRLSVTLHHAGTLLTSHVCVQLVSYTS